MTRQPERWRFRFLFLLILLATSVFLHVSGKKPNLPSSTTKHFGRTQKNQKILGEKKKNRKRKKKTKLTSTRVTGYGSNHHKSISADSEDEPRTNNDTVKCYLRIASSLQDDLETPTSTNHLQVILQNQKENSILNIYPNNNFTLDDRDSLLSELKDNGHPVEGLFGVYNIPSGKVYVWIVLSETIYQAPPCESKKETNDNNSKTTTMLLEEDWWTIRKITHVHLVRVPDTCAGTTTLGRAKRQEETRQLALLRQALKHHDWFYSVGKIVPDMTFNLQQSIENRHLLLSKLESKKKNNTWQLVNENNTSLQDEMTQDEILRPWWDQNSMNETHGSNTTHVRQTRPDSRFFWNEAIVEPLVQQLAESRDENQTKACSAILDLVIPVTSAFCGIRTNLTILSTAALNSQQLYYDQILITRRSRFRAGTRFTKRGADATGAVANYAETEQIVFLWQQPSSWSSSNSDRQKNLTALMSHVQTRGSIPLRWSSPTDIKTYRPRIRIGTDPIAQARAVFQHLVDQGMRYIILQNDTTLTGGNGSHRKKKKHPSLIMVNLIDKKSDQGRLGRALDAVLQAVLDVYKAEPDPQFSWLEASNIEHLWFDFHAEVKAGRWDKLVGLLEQLQPALIGHGYFRAHPNNAGVSDVPFSVEKLQTGVIRTNCMDCLDRTNVVQSIFGRYIMFHQLADIKVASMPLAFKAGFRQSPMTLPWQEGEVSHRLLWADNADAISRLYAGTPALKGDFTRTGKRTKKGALDDGMNSLQRYYLNNFMDADRQEGIDLLVGHTLFSNLNDDDDFWDVRNETPKNWNDLVGNGMSVKDAARLMLLGIGDKDTRTEGDIDHVRIKVKNRNNRVFESNAKRRTLDLRWLPGDLQSQFRSFTVASSSQYLPGGFSAAESLQAMDRRAASDAPWWAVSDSSSDASPVEEDVSLIHGVEAAAANNAGYLLGALIAGTQAPFAVAVFVISLIALCFPQIKSTGDIILENNTE